MNDILTKQAIEEIKRLRAISADLLAALEEIALGRGPYKIDPMAHAESVIEAMKDVANAAIAAVTATTISDGHLTPD